MPSGRPVARHPALKLLLSVSLFCASLSSTALAQTTLDPAPAPAQTEPAQTEPVQPSPGPLTLTARPGVTAEYTTSSSVQFTDFDISFAPLPGRMLSAAEQTQLKRLSDNAAVQFADLGTLVAAPPQRTRTRQTLRVLAADSAGNSVLLTTVITPPVIAFRAGQVAAPAQITRLTRTVSPSGQLVSFKVQTGDPQRQLAYERLNYADVLSALSLSDATSLYGLALKSGAARTAVQPLDLSTFFGSLADALGGPGTGISLKAQPLQLNVTTTFQGEDAGGTRRYDQTYRASPWILKLSTRGSDGQTITLKFATTDWSGEGTLSYRPDGLPDGGELTQKIGMTLSAELPGLPVQLRARFGATLSLSSKAK
ncbi:hypothetical protein [Deinococcus sp.]|uniref:hypothetical protein n=1 Tax=Deinococcus sp. TaxID=47478 RepID=UPI0025E13984|nr:hypothetical protein [Deinococcus sp.]